MSVDDTVLGLWKALSSRDWEAVKTFLSDDCIYADMPVDLHSPHGARRTSSSGSRSGSSRWRPYVNHDGLLVSNGSDAMYEHSETWGWDTGETALLRFVTVHRVDRWQGDHLEGLLGSRRDDEPGTADLAGGHGQGRHLMGVRRDGVGLKESV